MCFISNDDNSAPSLHCHCTRAFYLAVVLKQRSRLAIKLFQYKCRNTTPDTRQAVMVPRW